MERISQDDFDADDPFAPAVRSAPGAGGSVCGPRVFGGAFGAWVDGSGGGVGACVALSVGLGDGDFDADADAVADGRVDDLSSPVHPVSVSAVARASPHAAARRRRKAGRDTVAMAKAELHDRYGRAGGIAAERGGTGSAHPNAPHG
ncbi:hypothetical protein [Streptomyces sp. NPDC037389]|uniref:hypothetical protein n=1 Tax=Streptomyces sp. NPDC037389 TaxID=3155369 RepID=UPI0033F4EBFB